MAFYVDGFVLPVPTTHLAAYRMLATPPKDMPFDGMRMFWGGFKSIVEY